MKIGELAKMAQCTTETIRFYEKIGLLFPAFRNENNYRFYGEKHIERLKFVRNCRALEMSHDEIRTLIEITEQPISCSEHDHIHQLLTEHLHHIDERINELTHLRQQLSALQQHCQQSEPLCGIVQELSEMEITNKSIKNHL